jgi:hypothetical protein
MRSNVIWTVGLGACIMAGLAYGQQSSSSNSTTKQGSASSSAQGSASSSGRASGSGSGGGSAASMPRPTHVILHEGGSEWDATKRPIDQKGIEGHIRYMTALAKQGKVIWGGPWRDEPGGMTLLRVS